MKSLHIFLGVDMRMGHLGLTDYAKKQDVDLTALPLLTAAIFISKNKMRVKSFSYNGVISYLIQRDPRRPIDLSIINELPRAFSSDGSFDYNKVLKEMLIKKLGQKNLDASLIQLGGEKSNELAKPRSIIRRRATLDRNKRPLLQKDNRELHNNKSKDAHS